MEEMKVGRKARKSCGGEVSGFFCFSLRDKIKSRICRERFYAFGWLACVHMDDREWGIDVLILRSLQRIQKPGDISLSVGRDTCY